MSHSVLCQMERWVMWFLTTTFFKCSGQPLRQSGESLECRNISRRQLRKRTGFFLRCGSLALGKKVSILYHQNIIIHSKFSLQWQQCPTTALLPNHFLHQILQFDTELPFVYLFASCLHTFAQSSKTPVSDSVHTYQLDSHTVLNGDMADCTKWLEQF